VVLRRWILGKYTSCYFLGVKPSTSFVGQPEEKHGYKIALRARVVISITSNAKKREKTLFSFLGEKEKTLLRIVLRTLLKPY